MKTVLVSGFFDPLHRGHIEYFREAKKLGDKLIVHVHRDECCVKKKGYCFMPLEDRKAVLEAIKYVDEVVVCGEDCDLTVAKDLERIKPDVFAKGGDRTLENLPKSEVETCRKFGIEIAFGVGGGKVQSSSWLVDKFRKAKLKSEG
ncbi:adenylyltransferase/cytidyltransferase family protein [Candidatus Bathyarchaeota archaeon]|nr:adenylyltransferase/cytidyltransferase family protein [Candidatus Bathyarchaeota archaeon]